MRFITKKAFRAWLKAQEPNAVVGLRGMRSCPLAKATGLAVGQRYWFPLPSWRAHLLPAWARRFVTIIDTCPVSGTPVTAVEALAALREGG